jgi:hypothetical protein
MKLVKIPSTEMMMELCARGYRNRRCAEHGFAVPLVIARSVSDEAIHPSVMPRDGLLRCARNDGEAFSIVMAGLVPAIHVFALASAKNLDARDI